MQLLAERQAVPAGVQPARHSVPGVGERGRQRGRRRFRQARQEYSMNGDRRMKRTQGGMTLIGFVIVLGVIGFFAYIGMKLVPIYSEYYAVKQALKGLQEQPGIGNADPTRSQDLFFRRPYLSYAENGKLDHVALEWRGRTDERAVGQEWVRTVLSRGCVLVYH